MKIFHKISELSSQGIPLVVVSVTEKFGDGPVEVGKKMIVTYTNDAYGTVGGGALEYSARELAKTLFESRKSMTKTYLLHEGVVIKDATTLPMACGGKVTLFFEYIGPQEYIYIFGAGHVGQALTNILKTMNFHVTVVDERKEVIDRFQHGDEVILSPFTDFIETTGIKPQSFVVVCTPSHKYDYNVLHKVMEKQIPLRYIGMLCSVDKLKDYLTKTEEQFGKKMPLHNFYSPIGLDLGGGSPEEIAISITAEILAISHGKQGHKHMRELVDDTHRYWQD